MIVTQLADFLNNTMIPQYLGKEAIKVEDLSPLVSVGAYTKVEAPPVEPTKIASMKISDYTEGTATIVNTEGETSFGALSSGAEVTNTEYETVTFTVSDCVTQEDDGIGIKYTGRITYPLDLTTDDYIITLTASISELTSIEGIFSMISNRIGIMGYVANSATNTNIISLSKNKVSSNNVLTVECITDGDVSDNAFYTTDIETATIGHSSTKIYINVPLDDAGLSSEDLEDDVTFMIISVGDYIVVSINDIVICTAAKDHINFGTGPFTFYTGYWSDTAPLSYTGTIKEFEIFRINEE